MHYGEYSRKYKIFYDVCKILKYETSIKDVNDFTLNIVSDLYDIAKKFTDYAIILWIIAIIELIVILFLVF